MELGVGILSPTNVLLGLILTDTLEMGVIELVVCKEGDGTAVNDIPREYDAAGVILLSGERLGITVPDTCWLGFVV